MRFKLTHLPVFVVGLMSGCFLVSLMSLPSSNLPGGVSSRNLQMNQEVPGVAGVLMEHPVEASQAESPVVRKEYTICPFKELKPPYDPSKRYIKLEHELVARKTLYVGVLATDKHFLSRCTGVYDTWGTAADGLNFFDAKGRHLQSGDDLPLIHLEFENVNSLLAHFRVWEYIMENLLDQYEFFMVTRDDVYVKIEELTKLFQTINPQQPIYFGSVVYGREELHYCRDTSGVVLSRAALVKLAPHFEDCFKSHIDNVDRPPSFGILFGKCIHQILAIGCTWSQGVFDLYYADIDQLLSKEAMYQSKVIEQALILYPVSSADEMHKVHQYYLHGKVSKTMKELRKLRKDLVHENVFLLPDNLYFRNSKWVSLRSHSPYWMESIMTWNYFNSTQLCSLNDNDIPMVDLPQEYKMATERVINFIAEQLNEEDDIWSSQYRLYDAFIKHDPFVGDEYAMRITLFKHEGEGKELVANVLLPFEEPGLLKWQMWSEIWDNIEMYVVVHVGIHESLYMELFLNMYKKVVIDTGLPINLLLYACSHDNLGISFMIEDFQKQHPSNNIELLTNYNSTKCVATGSYELAARKLKPKDVMVLVSTTTILTWQFFHHCAMHVIHGKQAYVPIPFQYYHDRMQPQPFPSQSVHTDVGYWNAEDFQTVAIYAMDYDEFREGQNFNKFIDKMLRRPNFEIIRAIDPSLGKLYSDVTCLSVDVEQEDCTPHPGVLGSRKQLGSVLYRNHKELLS